MKRPEKLYQQRHTRELNGFHSQGSLQWKPGTAHVKRAGLNRRPCLFGRPIHHQGLAPVGPAPVSLSRGEIPKKGSAIKFDSIDLSRETVGWRGWPANPPRLLARAARGDAPRPRSCPAGGRRASPNWVPKCRVAGRSGATDVIGQSDRRYLARGGCPDPVSSDRAKESHVMFAA